MIDGYAVTLQAPISSSAVIYICDQSFDYELATFVFFFCFSDSNTFCYEQESGKLVVFKNYFSHFVLLLQNMYMNLV